MSQWEEKSVTGVPGAEQ